MRTTTIFDNQALTIINPPPLTIMKYLKGNDPQEALRWAFRAKVSKRKQAEYLRSRYKARGNSSSAVEAWMSRDYFEVQTTNKGKTNVRGI